MKKEILYKSVYEQIFNYKDIVFHILLPVYFLKSKEITITTTDINFLFIEGHIQRKQWSYSKKTIARLTISVNNEKLIFPQ
jgi:hypothetical protein